MPPHRWQTAQPAHGHSSVCRVCHRYGGKLISCSFQRSPCKVCHRMHRFVRPRAGGSPPRAGPTWNAPSASKKQDWPVPCVFRFRPARRGGGRAPKGRPNGTPPGERSRGCGGGTLPHSRGGEWGCWSAPGREEAGGERQRLTVSGHGDIHLTGPTRRR